MFLDVYVVNSDVPRPPEHCTPCSAVMLAAFAANATLLPA